MQRELSCALPCSPGMLHGKELGCAQGSELHLLLPAAWFLHPAGKTKGLHLFYFMPHQEQCIAEF